MHLLFQQKAAVAKHFVALSTNGVSCIKLLFFLFEASPSILKPAFFFKKKKSLYKLSSFYVSPLQPKVKDFGIDTENMFEFWDVSVL